MKVGDKLECVDLPKGVHTVPNEHLVLGQLYEAEIVGYTVVKVVGMATFWLQYRFKVINDKPIDWLAINKEFS